MSLADMIAARDYIDFPTGWALQADPRCPEHDPHCSAVVGGGAFLCDCSAIRSLWCRLRDEFGLPVPVAERPENVNRSCRKCAVGAR